MARSAYSRRFVPKLANRPRPGRRSSRPAVEGLESRSLLATLFALTDQDTILSFDGASPGTIARTIPITGLPSGESILAVDIQPSTGTVFGLGSLSHLYTINLNTGAAAAISSSAFAQTLPADQFAIDTNPLTNLIRVVDNAGQNFRLDPTTGVLIGPDNQPAYVAGDPNSGKTPDLVALSYTGGVGATATTAYTIDAMDGNAAAELVELGSPGGTPNPPESGDLETVGSLGVTISDAAGFDIDSANGTAYAVLTPPVGSGSLAPALYTINLTTGKATEAGTLGAIGSAAIIGLATANLAAPSAPTLAASSDSGYSSTDHVTNVKTPLIQGTALPGAAVTILANGAAVGQGTANAQGGYSITLSSLADGTYTVEAVQSEASGLTSAPSSPLSPPLVIKTSAPAPSTPSLFSADDTGFSDSDNFTRNNAPLFLGQGEPGDVVSLYANGVGVGQGVVNGGGIYTIQLGSLATGTYVIVANETDAAGNVSVLSSAVTPLFTIDNSTRPTPQQAYVGQLYLDLLGRPADQGGLSSFLPLLNQTNGRAAIVTAILGSTEYRNFVATTAYQQVLGRTPSSAEISAGAAYFAAHGNEALDAILAGGTEFFKKSGSTVAGFLSAVYLDFLGRPIDAPGQAYFTALLKAGASTTTVAYDVIISNEGYTRIVNGLSEQYLGHAADPTTLAADVALLKAGGTDQQIITTLATSNAFFGEAQGSGVVINQWIKQVYLDLEGVAIDPATQAALSGQLAQGTTTPLQSVQTILSSAAYRDAVVTNLYGTILGRSPEASALTSGAAYLAAGGTIEGLKTGLYASAEYFADTGGTNSGFLAAIYPALLGRPIDAASLQSALALLGSGFSRASLVTYLIGTPEGSQHSVQTIYLTYLRRVPTYSETSAYSGQLAAGVITDQSIIASLVTSSEYFAGL